MLKLLEKYQNEMKKESVKVVNNYKNNIKNEYSASAKSFKKFSNSVKNSVENVIVGVLHKYKSQIAIAGYYEIVVVFYGLVPITISSDHCNERQLLTAQWVLFIILFGTGLIAQFQAFIVAFNPINICR
eukprot:163983_1